MTYKYRPDSEWLGRIIDCFTWDIADHNPANSATRRGSDVSDTASKNGDPGDAGGGDTETMKDEVLLFLRSYKTVLDYNPEDIPARFVAELDNVKVIVSLVAVRYICMLFRVCFAHIFLFGQRLSHRQSEIRPLDLASEEPGPKQN